MKKIFLTCITLLFVNIFSLLAQETFQVRRIINCLDKSGATQIGILTDSPNQRFVSIERELQRYLIEWVWAGKLQAYYYNDKFADLSRKMNKEVFQNKMLCFNEAFGDSIEFRPIDFFEFALEENVNYQNDKFQYDIQALVLYIPEGCIEDKYSKSKEAIARFRYSDLAKLWTETYEESLKTKLYGGLECFVQVYHDNTQTISMTEALEKRYFNSRIETVIPASKKTILSKEKEYNREALQKKGITYLPQFTQISKNRITTSITEAIDLEQEKEFTKDNNVLVRVIVEGVRSGEIQAYFFSGMPRYAYAFSQAGYRSYIQNFLMSKQEFEKKLKSYTYQTDTVKIKPKVTAINQKVIDSTDLKIEEISRLDIQSIVEVDKGRSVTFTPYHITLAVPQSKGKQVEMPQKYIASFKYEDIEKYLNQLAQKSDEYTFTTQNQRKISFGEAIKQRLFNSPLLYTYDTIFAQYIKTFLQDKYGNELDNLEQKIKEEGKAVLEYIESLGK